MSMWQKLLALSCCIVLNINTMQPEKPNSDTNNDSQEQFLNHLSIPKPLLYEQADTQGKQVIIVRYGTDVRAGTPFFVDRTTTIEEVAAHMKLVTNKIISQWFMRYIEHGGLHSEIGNQGGQKKNQKNWT